MKPPPLPPDGSASSTRLQDEMGETRPEKVKVGSKGKKGCYSSFFSVLLVLLIPGLLLGGYWAQRAGFEKIRQMRQLERIPHVEAVALIEGEVTMTGRAVDGGEMVNGKYKLAWMIA